MKPEIGKWYIVKDFENRGPGKVLGYNCENNTILIEHKSKISEGHAPTMLGIDGIQENSWFYGQNRVFTEVPDPNAKPITEFKAGHWYKWIGPMNYSLKWNPEMNVWKDGKSRQARQNGLWSDFIDISHKFYYGDCIKHFVECDPPEEKKIGPLRIDLHSKDVLQEAKEYTGSLGSKLTVDVPVGLLAALKQDDLNKLTGSKKSKILSRAQRRKDVLSRLSID